MAGGRPGPAPQTAKREQYAALIARGVSFSEACRLVGINRRTGKRWRHGRTITSSNGQRLHYPPVVGVKRKREISARFLSEDERVRIADLRRAGEGVRAIARELGRDPATVSRELRRNVDPKSSAYRPHTAQRLAEQRRARPKAGKLVADVELRRFVQDKLKRRWSPEQIARALRSEFPDQPHRHVVPETIYQAVYRPDLGGLCRELPKALRTGRLRRKPHRRAEERRGRLVNMTMIDQRPAEAAGREVAGHWEGDLITGEANRSAIGTLVERASRYAILLYLPGRHTAEAVRDAVIDAMKDLPTHLRRSLTWDQGSEMALHAEIAQALGMPVYFCEKASPWQRPSNENTNGLLRQYFPKGTDLRRHDAEQLTAAADELNTRPRKTLSWQTPAERLADVTVSPRPAPARASGRRSARAGRVPGSADAGHA
ncbi:MAG TPA: IS30 family transposase [Streptosporangiaceae bacterium]